ncbi:MAG TPA: hypothetical protein VFE26_06455, partial [Trebonia sp.]|nr:hypothetical protein [Trebonia sp.]
HNEGGAIFPQLWHIGAHRRPSSPPYPDAPVISPSGLAAAGKAVAEPATVADLEGVAAAFARAAAEAQAAGFDGVELHGAHGYLLDQFHWPVTNRRTDRYGGDMAGRVRFSAEVVAAVRAATGPQFPIAFRFSQWKGSDYNAQIAENPAELEAFLAPLAAAGVSVFHASTRRYWVPAFDGPGRTLAGWTRQLTGLPVITVGSVGVAAPFLGVADDGKTAAERQRSLTLAPLVEAGVSMFHASTRRYWLPAFDGSARTMAGWTRHLSGRPVIGIGSVGVGAPFMSITDDASSGRAPSLSLAPLADLVNRGEFDLVALGRACLADPHWAVKVSSGRLSEIRPYNKSADAFLY